MKDYSATIITLVLALAAMTAGGIAVAIQRDNLQTDLSNFKKEAVSRGFAEWKVLEQDKTEFIWKEK